MTISDSSGAVPRIVPLGPYELDESMEEVVAELVMNPDGELGPRRAGDPIGSFVGALLRYPDLCKAFTTLASFLLRHGELSVLHRELITLRTAWLCRCPYQWFHHVDVAHNLGLSPLDIDAVVVGSTSEIWNAPERSILELVDSLHVSASIPNDLWSTLSQHFSEQERMELIALVGSCHSVAFMVNGLHIAPNEDGLDAR